jgi:hypothetical protein
MADAHALGYRLAILPGVLLSAVIAAADQALRSLAETGAAPPVSTGATILETFRRFGADEWSALAGREGPED